MRQLRPHSSYSEDTAVDNVSSPKPRTCGAYSEYTQIRAGDNGGSLRACTDLRLLRAVTRFQARCRGSPTRSASPDPGVVNRRGHVHVNERSRDATATCCAVSVSPGLIPRGSHRPRAARPAARQRSRRGHRARAIANAAVGTVMGRSSAAEICLVGPFAGQTD